MFLRSGRCYQYIIYIGPHAGEIPYHGVDKALEGRRSVSESKWEPEILICPKRRMNGRLSDIVWMNWYVIKCIL
jgi:hypothetical protein